MRTDLCWLVIAGEKNGQDCGTTQEVLDLESINVGVVGWLVVVEHQPHCVR